MIWTHYDGGIHPLQLLTRHNPSTYSVLVGFKSITYDWKACCSETKNPPSFLSEFRWALFRVNTLPRATRRISRNGRGVSIPDTIPCAQGNLWPFILWFKFTLIFFKELRCHFSKVSFFKCFLYLYSLPWHPSQGEMGEAEVWECGGEHRRTPRVVQNTAFLPHRWLAVLHVCVITSHLWLLWQLQGLPLSVRRSWLEGWHSRTMIGGKRRPKSRRY